MPSRLPLYLIMMTLVKWHVDILVLLCLLCGQGAVEHVDKVVLPCWWMPASQCQQDLWLLLQCPASLLAELLVHTGLVLMYPIVQ
jgi:hypothetical protein